jgi:hypothetical protein
MDFPEADEPPRRAFVTLDDVARSTLKYAAE